MTLSWHCCCLLCLALYDLITYVLCCFWVVLLVQPDSGEMALDVVDQLVRSSAVDIVVVDSVAALVPRVELEGGFYYYIIYH